uniref:Uroporphyrinogen-III synthase n=1 Tax=uncultured delta proteobacterium HF0200_39L23 TaxID=710832 RepID=E0XXX2_9DELT|nr:uroporphyrinogen-III synthase [uncultured delta proteobacterium HF0200_39L23]
MKGQNILVTRQESSDHSLSEKLLSLGAEVHNHPLISIHPPDSWDSFDQYLNQLNKIDWVVFTSRNGVLFTFKRLVELGVSTDILKSLRIACFPAAAEALRQKNIETDLVPSHHQSERLIQEFKKLNLSELCFWLVQAEEPRFTLQEELLKMNAEVMTSTVYTNRIPKTDFSPLLRLLHLKKLDWIVLASASAVRNLFSIIPSHWDSEWFNSLKVACLGEITASVAFSHGLKVEIQPEVQDFEHLVQAMADHVSNKEGRT